MRPLLVIVLAIAACVPAIIGMAPAPAAAYQHIANGGFEDGADGWVPAPGTTLEIDEASPFEGARSAALTLNASGIASVRTLIGGALGPGEYVLRLHARSGSASFMVSPRLTLAAGGAAGYADLGSADVEPGAWAEAGGTVTIVEATGAVIVIDLAGAAGSRVLIDAVSLDGAAPVAAQPSPSPTPPLTLTDSTPAPSASAWPTVSVTPSPTPTPLLDVIGPALRNPGFEELDATALPFAWEKYGGTVASANRAHDGERAAELTSDTASTKWLHQAVTVSPSAWYDFSAWLLLESPGVAALRIAWYASGDASGSQISTVDAAERLASPSPGYRFLATGPVQSPPEARSARVRILFSPSTSSRAHLLVDDAWFGHADPPIMPSATTQASVSAAGSSAAGQADAATSGSARTPRRSSQALDDSRGAATGDIVLNEVVYDPSGDVADADAEWVEVYNRSDTTVDLAGWSLADGRSAETLPSLVVPARGFAVIAASKAFLDQYPGIDTPVLVLGGRIGNGLGNDGDVLVLIDPGGRFIDAVSWGENQAALTPPVEDVPEGHSIEREVPGIDADAAADWIDNVRPTPGGPFVAAVAAPRSSAGGHVEVLGGSPARGFDWLPWAVASASIAVLLGTAGWRALETARSRARQP